MSIAHLKELVVAVTILGEPYDRAITTLRDMKNRVNSAEWDDYGSGKVYQSIAMPAAMG